MNLSLAEAIFSIAALACVVAQIVLLRSSFTMKSADRSERVPASPRAVELTWALIPALLLSVLLVVTWRKVAWLDEHQRMDHSTSGPTADNRTMPPVDFGG